MVDFAKIGFEADTSGLVKGEQALDSLASAADRAGDKAIELAGDFQQAGTTMGSSLGNATRQIARDLDQTGVKFRSLQEQINQGLRIGAGPSSAAASASSMTAQLDALREKYVPLARAQREYQASIAEIDRAARVGAISEKERASAVATATAALQRQTVYLGQTGAQAKLTGAQMQQLGFQVNDLATQIASGASPFQAIAQQGGQIYQALGMGPGGVGGALRALGGMVASFATSATAGFAAATAVVGGMLLVINKATSDTRDLERALSTGLARGAGLTVDQLRDISRASAEAAQVSKAAAQEMAMEFAKTGRVTSSLLGDLTILSARYAKTIGADGVEAAADLAKAFADPLKGLESLEKRIGAFDDRTRQLVRSSAQVGDTFAAQRALAEGLRAALVELPDRIETIGDAWEAVKRKVSNTAQAALGIRTLSERIKEAEADLAGFSAARGANFPAGESRVRAAMERLSKLYEEQAKREAEAAERAEAARRARLAQTADTIVRGIQPIESAYEDLLEKQRKIEEALAEGVVDPSRIGASFAALDEINNQLERFGDGSDLAGLKAREAAQAFDLEVEAIRALTDVERAAIAGRQAYARAIEQGLGAQRAKIEQDRAEARSLEELIARTNAKAKAQNDSARTLDAGTNAMRAGGGTGAGASAMELARELRPLAQEIEALEKRIAEAGSAGGGSEMLREKLESLREAYSRLQAEIIAAQAAQVSFDAAQAAAGMRERAKVQNAGTAALRSGAGSFMAESAMEAQRALGPLVEKIKELEEAWKRANAAGDLAQMSVLAEAISKLQGSYRNLSNAIEVSRRAQSNLNGAMQAANLRDRLEMLQLETSLVRASTEERYRAIEALKTEQWIRSNMDANSAAADDVRRLSRAVTEQQITLDKAREKADRYSDSIRGVGRAATEATRALGEFATTGANSWNNFATTQGSGSQQFTVVAQSVEFLLDIERRAREERRSNARKTQISSLGGSISSNETMLAELLAGMNNARNPDPYAEKRADVFYDPNAGNFFNAEKQAEVNRLREQIALEKAQLAALEKIEAKLNPPQGAATPIQDAAVAYRNFMLGSPGFFRSVPGFATGGSFTVGGSGGTDSKMVSFRASPGERVTIQTPQQQRGMNDNGRSGSAYNDNRRTEINITIPIDASKLTRPGEDPAIVRRRLGDEVAREIKRRMG